MAKRPLTVEIRTYQVGFGDCFLLSFVYSAKDRRHVLIDFGSTGLPRRGKGSLKPSQFMPLVAKDIAAVCGGGRLTAVVATHRHADHINGFGTDDKTGRSGLVIRGLRPRLVLQPWTEDPDAARDAKAATRGSSRSRKSFVAGLRARQEVARTLLRVTTRRPSWMSAALARELSFLGEMNIANKSAVQNLITMGRAKGSSAEWARHGSRTRLERLLPGVKIRILGPPDLTQTEAIQKMRKRDPDQFWHLLAGAAAAREAGALPTQVKGPRSRGRPAPVPLEGRWFRHRLETLRGSHLLEIVRTLDDEMNNTSLILLFEVFGKKLLFPGDAQIENWSYALVDAPDAKATRTRLAGVDVYKVGHHGSLNATPRKLLWQGFAKRGPKKKLTTLLSTMRGKHGKVASKTEVPRRTLLDALETESDLKSTLDLSVAARSLALCHVTTLKP
jgi:hypothetical protein